ncbi:hypothetical protein [Methylobacterium dankookense]|nr:hypothetical protein [Methylobacterium dankookense]
MVQSRAIIGVIALYALLLQAFLGGLSPSVSTPAGPEICARHDAASVPVDHESACRQHVCCTAMQGAGWLLPLPTAFATVTWAPVQVASAAWREAGPVRARAPPDRSVGPRGPPIL